MHQDTKRMDEPVDIVVPVFNEAASLPELYQRIAALPIAWRLIFVDNGSTDGSLDLMRGYANARVISHVRNEGYGASLRDGIAAATAEKIIIIDADCEYPPEAIPEMVRALDHHEVVYASRFLDDRNSGMGFVKSWGNRIISNLFNALFQQYVTDLYTGSKGFCRRVVADLPMRRDGFEHVLEIAARLARKGVRIHEIPVDFRARRSGVSKMSHLSETIKYLVLLCYYFITVPVSGKNRS